MEYEIEGFSEMELKIARTAALYDRRAERSALKNYRRRTKPEDIGVSITAESKHGDMSLPYTDALTLAKETFEKSTVLHLSYLVSLNAGLAPKLYRYFIAHYPCKEIRKGTLRLVRK